MRTLTIHWQRLLADEKTCPRCGATEIAVEKAVSLLTQALAPLGIAVVLQKAALSLDEFKQNPLQSNAIRLNGRLLEEWLGAKSGQSECCEVCGPNECRTVAVEETVYEAVPEELIVKAGLLAAAELLSQKECGCEPVAPSSGGGCCSKG